VESEFSNPDLTMPPKPSDKQRALAFYNIDFSLQNQVFVYKSREFPFAKSYALLGKLQTQQPHH
jgi:hypothetical protein